MFDETELRQQMAAASIPPIQAECLAGLFRRTPALVQQSVAAELDKRGCLTEAKLDDRIGAKCVAELEQRNYLTPAALEAELDRRGYLTEEAFASKLVIELDRRQYATKSEFEELRDDIKALDDKLDRRVDQLDKKLDEKVGQLDKKLDEKVDQLDKKLDDKLDRRVGDLKADIKSVGAWTIGILSLVIAAAGVLVALWLR